MKRVRQSAGASDNFPKQQEHTPPPNQQYKKRNRNKLAIMMNPNSFLPSPWLGKWSNLLTIVTILAQSYQNTTTCWANEEPTCSLWKNQDETGCPEGEEQGTTSSSNESARKITRTSSTTSSSTTSTTTSSTTTSTSSSASTTSETQECGLYWAPSSWNVGGVLYLGHREEAIPIGESLWSDNPDQDGDLMVPLVDVNKNEFSPWHQHVWQSGMFPGLSLEHDYLGDVYLGGLGTMASCARPPLTGPANIAVKTVLDRPGNPLDQDYDSETILPDRSRHATAGSFSTHAHVVSYRALRPIAPGDALLMECGKEDDDDHDRIHQRLQEEDQGRRSLAWLQHHAVCVDTLSIGPSSWGPHGPVGRGAFAKQAFTTGQVVASTPVMPLDRTQFHRPLQQLHQAPVDPHHPEEVAPVELPIFRDHGIQYSSTVLGQQLLLNYAFGHDQSNVLLLPMAPAVTFINHAPSSHTREAATVSSSAAEANVALRWAPSSSIWHEQRRYLPYDDDVEDNDDDALLWQQVTVMELLEAPVGALGLMVIEFVALRDIAVGEEILLDYGASWRQAWQQHVESWTPAEDGYVSAESYLAQHEDEPFRTVAEQTTQPYPWNIHTICAFAHDPVPSPTSRRSRKTHQSVVMEHWSTHHGMAQCWRPCRIESRYPDKDDGAFRYTAVVYPMNSIMEPDSCGMVPEQGVLVAQIPDQAVTLADRPYTSDLFLPQAFRHEIGVPDGFFSDHWMATDLDPYGDFIASPLVPGQLAPIRWKENARVVTPWAFRLGLPTQLRTVLLEYCNKMGITDLFRHVTINGNSLEPSIEEHIDVQGYDWFIQRPEDDWRSNLHWISPGDYDSHRHYLQALGAAGFDQVLKAIGEQLGLTGLVAYQVTFIAVSYSNKGFIHHDVINTGGKAFNVIIPLTLANHTGPELDLQEWDPITDEEGPMGRYRYEYDVAAVMGDGAEHATSAVDYRPYREMRMAATVYVADVHEGNVKAILNEYTQTFPPLDLSLLMSWAGRHWRRDDPSVKLPRPDPNHILYAKYP